MLEKSINYALALDPGSQQALRSIQYKTIMIKCESPDCYFSVHIDSHDLITLHQHQNEAYDLTIAGKSSDFLALLQNLSCDDPLLHSDIVVTGDKQLFYQLLAIFIQLDIDYEEGLSHIVGDFAAHPMASALSKTYHWHRHQHDKVAQMVSEYLQHELEALPSAEEFQHFSVQVSQLNKDIIALTEKAKYLANTVVQELDDKE